MTPEQREIIQSNEPQLVHDIIPTDLLLYLPCLTYDDREVITVEERNQGGIKAASVLLDRLRRRGNGAFEQLVRALRDNSLRHLALLLDPHNKGNQHTVVTTILLLTHNTYSHITYLCGGLGANGWRSAVCQFTKPLQLLGFRSRDLCTSSSDPTTRLHLSH